jgi:hypothetical protein
LRFAIIDRLTVDITVDGELIDQPSNGRKPSSRGFRSSSQLTGEDRSTPTMRPMKAKPTAITSVKSPQVHPMIPRHSTDGALVAPKQIAQRLDATIDTDPHGWRNDLHAALAAFRDSPLGTRSPVSIPPYVARHSQYYNEQISRKSIDHH